MEAATTHAASAPRRTLSHSSTETLSQCPRRFQLEKLDRVPRAPAPALIGGIALHTALERLGGALVMGEPLPALRELETEYLDAFAEALAEGDPLECITAEEASLLAARGLAMLRAFVERVAPHYRPVAVEADFSVPIPGLPEWQLTGRIDAKTHARQADGSVVATIVDHKSAGKPWPAGAEHGKGQASAYLLAHPDAGQVTFVVLATHVPRGWTVDGDEQIAVRVDVRPTTRTQAQLDDYAAFLRASASVLKRGVFEPRPGPLCGWCGVVQCCPEGRGWLAAHRREVQPEIARFMERS